MKAGLLFVLMALFFMSGCGGSYTHPTKGAEEYSKDVKVCEAEAAGQFDGMTNRSIAEKNCIRRKGWVPGEAKKGAKEGAKQEAPK